MGESRQKKDRPWSAYPLGTKAHAIGGGHWIRVEHGWRWNAGGGGTFPTPGADAFDVTLPSVSPAERAGEGATTTATALGVDQEGSTARTEARAREFGPREVCENVGTPCRAHWHTRYSKAGSYATREEADAAALREWAESVSLEDVLLLESLAVAEEDRFNESGTYIPNEIPGILRRIAEDYVRYRAYAATQEGPERAPFPAVDPSWSTPDALAQPIARAALAGGDA